MKDTDLLNQIDNLGESMFNFIPQGTMKETSVTDCILSIIAEAQNKADFIQFDSSYKETGDPQKNDHHGTAADYILVIKDSSGGKHILSFQAKNGKIGNVNSGGGKKKKTIGNFYAELDHKIGGKGCYQVIKYDKFLEANEAVSGYYIFYNGNYKNVTNSKQISSLGGQSFWTITEKIVKTKMGSTYTPISLNDLYGVSEHEKMTDLLRGVMK